MLFIIHLSYIFLIRPLLEARAEIQKYFRCFLVQMKSLEFAFEINLPLAKTAVLKKTRATIQAIRQNRNSLIFFRLHCYKIQNVFAKHT